MKSRTKIYSLFTFVLCAILGGFFVLKSRSNSIKVSLIYSDSSFMQKQMDSLLLKIKKYAKTNSKLQKNIDFYIANFINTDIPDIKNHEHLNILWLGSNNNFNVDKIKKFDHVFASTKDLIAYLKIKDIKAHYQPQFIDSTNKNVKQPICALNPNNETCYFIVIGYPPKILDYFNKHNVKYKIYSNLNRETAKLLSDNFDNISGVVINSSRISNSSFDVSPFLLDVINYQIPILSPNSYYIDDNSLRDVAYFSLMFMDTLSYYTYENDIEKFLNCLSCRLDNAKKAKYLLDKVYSTDVFYEHIKSILEEKQFVPYIKNAMLIMSPTYAGIYNNGDYWISKDLENAFSFKYDQSLTIFPTSLIDNIGDVFIFVRGGIPLKKNQIKNYASSIYYLLFPSFVDESNLPSIGEFIDSIKEEFNRVDAVAVASKLVYNELKNRGINAYYIPQFTNTNKFYYDYKEDKKSEVLFVGNYLPYRTAAQSVFNAGLPITIYGNGWPDNMAKSSYIDNQILRQYYSSAKIVLNDARDSMKKFGFIINRIFDVTACGSLVISDYVKEIEDVYGDSVPMYKTKEELVKLVEYYLDPKNEAERLNKARRAKEITLENFTANIVAEMFDEVIKDIKKQKGL